ncbi:hypothetical protein E2C01_067354 [Portunus trituberculatus]|uniref:Uncharacterized protein n=1 Tax=Portunus trituberculatus TaxID=210409 RepID=A0A5B7HUT2_PORTR|nr:hypothetical protein [Portunus trituberculatus]
MRQTGGGEGRGAFPRVVVAVNIHQLTRRSLTAATSPWDSSAWTCEGNLDDSQAFRITHFQDINMPMHLKVFDFKQYPHR